MKTKIVFAAPLHSSQNVNSANIYNYGVVKAGDGGNGRRGTDGKGGIDRTDGTAPTNGTTGAAGGAAGSVGMAYYYSGQTTARPGNEETNTGAIQGTLIQIDQKKESAAISGSQGNNGWGGLNLTTYRADKEDLQKHYISDVDGHKEVDFGVFNLYANAGRGDVSVSYMTVYVKYELGRGARSDGLHVITEHEGSSTWLEIIYARQYGDTGRVDYTKTSQRYNDGDKFDIIYSTKGKIRFDGTCYFVGEKGRLRATVILCADNTSAQCYKYDGKII